MRKLVFLSLAFVTFITLVLTTFVFAENSKIVIKGGGDEDGKVRVVDVRNPYVGIYMDNVSRKRAKDLDYPKSGGVWILEVVDDSPAERAGLEDDDIIYMIDGDRVRDVEDLREIISERDPGDTLELVVYRDGEKREFRLELGERAKQYYTMDMDEDVQRFAKEWGSRDWSVYTDDYKDALKQFDFSTNYFQGRLRLGVSIHELSDDLAEYFDVKAGDGVLVLDVEEDSPAEKAGIKGGDVITAVGDVAVHDGEDLIEAINDYDEDDETIEVTVVRKGDSKSFEFKVEDLLNDDVAAIWMTPGKDFKHFKLTLPELADQKKIQELKARGMGDTVELEKLRKEIEILEKRLKKLEKEND